MSTDVLGYLLSKSLAVKPAPGHEVHLTCFFCGEDPASRGRLYINVDPDAEIPGLYECKKCTAHGALPTIMRHFGDRTPQEEKEDDGFIRRAILVAAAKFYHENLDDNIEALRWLTNRGLALETISDKQLGYANGGLYKHLRSMEFRVSDILATGLIAEDRASKKIGDFLKHHITIPYLVSGTPVMIRGRTLDPEDERKYVTPFGQKTRLYNTDVVWHADEIVIAEGELDCLIAEQMGFAAVAAPGCSSWQDAWDGYFSDARRVYVVFDNDVPGRRGAEKIVDRLGSKCRTVVLDEESLQKVDITDWAKQGNTSEDFAILLHRSAGGLLVRVADAIAEHRELQGLVGVRFGMAKLDRMIAPGLLPAQLMIPLASTGVGKQQPLDEPVLTPGGWRMMGELVVGDEVIGGDGKATTVLAVVPQGVKPVVRVTFSDGSWSRCGPEHLWSARTKHDKYRGRPWRTVPASELKPGWHVPVVEPVHHVQVPLPIDPYELGVLLGDGSLACGKACTVSFCTDTWIVAHLGWTSRPHKTSTFTAEGYVTTPGLREALQSLGLWGKLSWEKHVPSIYLLGTPADRLALLRGLLDTDGSPIPTGGVEFCSTSEALARAVAGLARSLGGIARVKPSRVTHYTYDGERKPGRPSWRVNVKLDVCPFLLPRKAERWVAPTKYECARVVRGVEPDGEAVEQVCIKVGNPDGLYVTRDYVVTHNTVWLINMFQRICLAQPDAKVLFVSLEQTRGDWWERARRIYRFFHMGASDADAENFWSEKLMLVDRNRITPEQLVQCIEDFDYEWGQMPTVVGLDYIGYYAQSFKGERYERVSDAVMSIKAVAKDLRVPIIAPHQVSRGNTRGTEPGIDNARDSGIIGETADFVLSLWSEDSQQGKKMEQRTGIFNMKVQKSRHGGAGYDETMRFAPLSLAMVPMFNGVDGAAAVVPERNDHSLVFSEGGPFWRYASDERMYETTWSNTWEQALIRHEAGLTKDEPDFNKVLAALNKKRQGQLN